MYSSNSPYDVASHVTAEEGEVMIDGPGGLAVAMTPEAAEETGRRLLEASTEARGQRDARLKLRPDRPMLSHDPGGTRR